MRGVLVPRGLAMLLVAGVIGGGAAVAFGQQAEQGRGLFQEKCTACHTIGQGDRVGPDLAGVTSRRDRAWLTRWISAPDKVLAEKDPIATALFAKYGSVPMPNQGLTGEQSAALVVYLETAPAGGGPGGAQASAAPLPAGNPAVGKELFMGTRRLQAGGPPCMACHSIAGIGALGGGALGPDLTLALSKYGGDAGLASVLAAIPFPTMSPIFGRRPLTVEEQAHLRTFMAQAAVIERSPAAVGQLTVLAIAGAAVLAGIVHLSWRRRLTGVRRRMLEGTRPARRAKPLTNR